MPQYPKVSRWFPFALLAVPAILLALWLIPHFQVASLRERMKAVTNPERLADLEKERIAVENNIRTSLVQGIGGGLVALTAYIGYLNYRALVEKNTAERFSKAVEQLGSDNILFCLSGIYELEQIAKDAEEKYYWQVIETLTAYVRLKSPASEAQNEPENTPVLATDIQAVMTVLARRKHSYRCGEDHRLDLRGTNLQGLHLPPGSNLAGADFSGANLQGAFLSKTRLQKGCFWKANLQKAELSESCLNDAMLAEANLEDASLWKAILDGSQLYKVNLRRALLSQGYFILITWLIR